MTSRIKNLGKLCKVPLILGCGIGSGQSLRAISECSQHKPKKTEKKATDCFSQFKPLSETRFSPVSHIIFDLDGVVLDTAKFYNEAHRRYLTKFKRRYTQEIKMNAIGIRDIDAAKYIVRELVLPISPEVYVHGIWQDLREMFTKTKFMDGAMALICHLHENNVPIALATSSNTKSFDLKMKPYQHVLDLFCVIVKGDDPELKYGKPKPDIYELTASRFLNRTGDMSKYLVIEDSTLGIQSASAAGMQSVMLRDKTIPKNLLKGAGLIVDSLKDIDLRDFQLPRMK